MVLQWTLVVVLSVLAALLSFFVLGPYVARFLLGS